MNRAGNRFRFSQNTLSTDCDAFPFGKASFYEKVKKFNLIETMKQRKKVGCPADTSVSLRRLGYLIGDGFPPAFQEIMGKKGREGTT
jgi:hypothetical protein